MSTVGIVIPWFGRDLKGGAELHAWHLATHLAARAHDVEVITTCCRSHGDDWAFNHYPPGLNSEPEGFSVRRFAVEPRERTHFDETNGRLLRIPHESLKPGVSPASEDDERVFVQQLIRSPSLLKYLETHKDHFKAVILLPYLYGPVIEGVRIVAAKALLQPCLHDEAYAYLPSIANCFYAARRLLFLSEGEQELAFRLFGPGIAPKSVLAGAGVEIDVAAAEDGSLLSRIGGERYILCLGRKDIGKKTDFLARCFKTYREKHSASQLRLVIAGPGEIKLPDNCPGLVEFGIVSDAQKRSLLRNCIALFHPSDNESYSRVIMEAWMYGRPAAASAKCLATASAISAGGGWLAETADEWSCLFETVNGADASQMNAMGARGKAYADKHASWESAIMRYEEAMEGLEVRPLAATSANDASMAPRVHQVLPNVAFGDAISNHAIWIKAELQRRGYQSEIFALGIDPKLSNDAKTFNEQCLTPNDSVIYHHSIGSAVTATVTAHPGPKILIYHNITPHSFLEAYLPVHARLCREGRQELSALAPNFPFSVGDSNFNALELADCGFANPLVLPICIDPSKWQMIPDPTTMSRLQDGRTNILFVGRLSPNKKQEDLIFAFAKFRKFDPAARLILVGTPVTENDLYLACLRRLCVALGISESVEFSGHVTDSQLLAYYRTAHIFWSMSEHEGFCVPLVEAMWFDIPVFAYSSSAVPETMADAGTLFTSKNDMEGLAAQAFQLVRDAKIRRAAIASQRKRRSAFLPSAVAPRLAEFVGKMMIPRDTCDEPITMNSIRPEEIRSVAVVKLDHIGDLLLAAPAFTSLRRRYPLATITALVAPASAGVLVNHPDVDVCISYDAPWFWRSVPDSAHISKILAANAQSMKHLMSMHFDLVVNLRSDLANLLIAASLPHSYLLSYTNDSSYHFLATHKITRTRGMHICEQHRFLLSQIGATHWNAPTLYPNKSDYDFVRSVVQQAPPIVAVFLGAGVPLKCWAAAKFKELIRRTRARGYSVAIIGSYSDFKLASDVADETGARNLCGQFDLLQLAAFLDDCAVLVTNDSAPMHIAASVNTAVVYITRPNTAQEFAPVGTQHIGCSAQQCTKPCEGFDATRRDKLVSYCECIQGISVDEVEHKLMKVLSTLTLSGIVGKKRLAGEAV